MTEFSFLGVTVPLSNKINRCREPGPDCLRVHFDIIVCSRSFEAVSRPNSTQH